jgi:hypothetical protein
VEGACTTSFVICDILKKEDMTFFGLKYASQFRILMPNEGYYQFYDGKEMYIAEEFEDDEE